MEKIIITISPEGEIKVEGEGFLGNACDVALGPYIRELGPALWTQRKPEYYEVKASPERGVQIGGE